MSSTGQCNALARCYTAEIYPKTFLERWFSFCAILSRYYCEYPDKSVPLGKYWRNNRFVFSLLPRCHGLCGSQKYTLISVDAQNDWWSAYSPPRSQVNVLRSVFGKIETWQISADTTLFVSFPSIRTSIVNLECQMKRALSAAWPDESGDAWAILFSTRLWLEYTSYDKSFHAKFACRCFEARTLNTPIFKMAVCITFSE